MIGGGGDCFLFDRQFLTSDRKGRKEEGVAWVVGREGWIDSGRDKKERKGDTTGRVVSERHFCVTQKNQQSRNKRDTILMHMALCVSRLFMLGSFTTAVRGSNK